MSNQYTQNENGLTWERWFNAATFGVRGKVESVTVDQLKAAWRAGECPCDYAAEMAAEAAAG